MPHSLGQPQLPDLGLASMSAAYSWRNFLKYWKPPSKSLSMPCGSLSPWNLNAQST